MSISNFTQTTLLAGYLIGTPRFIFYDMSFEVLCDILQIIATFQTTTIAGSGGGVWISNYGLFFRKFLNHIACFLSFPESRTMGKIFLTV